jgi:hypothetical protein
MTRAEQRRKAVELLTPPPARRDECLRDIDFALNRVSGRGVIVFRVLGSKKGKAGISRYANALRELRAAYQNLDPSIRPWFSITEFSFKVGESTHIEREIAKAEEFLAQPSPRSRASQHKAAVAAAYDLLAWWDHRATTTRGGMWAQLAGILIGDAKVDLFDLLRAFRQSPTPTVEKLRGARSILYRARR